MRLNTNYMGLELRSPIIVSACPLSEKLDNIKKMEDSGAGAIVLFSIFEEQLRQQTPSFENLSLRAPDLHADSLDFFPNHNDYQFDKSSYLELIQKAKTVTDIPIIGSLNGVTAGGWTESAKEMEGAGADAIELNIFFIPADITQDSIDIELQYRAVLESVKAKVDIPVAVKLHPYFSSIGNMARRLADNGANGLVLFNRFYEPDFDIETFEVRNTIELSSAPEIRLSLLWLGILHGNVKASLAASSGVEGHIEVVKYLLAGADVVMTASALMRKGIQHLQTMHVKLVQWMDENEFAHIEDMRGIMSRIRGSGTGSWERANYIRILKSL